MGKFNSKVEPPLGSDCVRLSRVHCTFYTICRETEIRSRVEY